MTKLSLAYLTTEAYWQKENNFIMAAKKFFWIRKVKIFMNSPGQK